MTVLDPPALSARNWRRARRKRVAEYAALADKLDCFKMYRKRPGLNRGVRCVETGRIFPSVKEAAKFIGRHPSGISSTVGTRLACGGYHWERIYDL